MGVSSASRFLQAKKIMLPVTCGVTRREEEKGEGRGSFVTSDVTRRKKKGVGQWCNVEGEKRVDS